MNKTFDTVDFKVAEVEFFLRKMVDAGSGMSEFSFYFSAYLSAARSLTHALQQFVDLDGFPKWYEPHQKSLKNDELARFFLDTRNSHVHGGEYPIKAGSFLGGHAKYHFSNYEHNNYTSEEDDVVKLSRRFFVKLLSIVYDCYLALGTQIDPQQHFTKEHFEALGKTIEQAEGEVFGWTNERLAEEERYGDVDRWIYLRSNVESCQINQAL